MAFLRQSEALSAYNRRYAYEAKTADRLLRESAAQFSKALTYDIFLSHANEDAKLILGLKVLLEEKRYRVYVDWDDPELDHNVVDARTAEILRVRMGSCSSLAFATTQNSPKSKWMPWELGYYDGLKRGPIGIVPLVADNSTSFKGQEYLSLYPVIESIPSKGELGMMKGSSLYVPLPEWIRGTNGVRALY
ncbi:MAG TPA: hypothetical protein VN577_12460 [Terriglobales bacterium]|nr:hypothetical protein [Terriglobales bacterium]